MTTPAPTARPPLAIVGTTASGKSELGQALARSLPGTELVSVDSMQVYRGMDIGTAKPSAAERAEIPHHCLDLVDPWEDFTLSQFQAAVREAVADIEARGAWPVLVGGTGLYLRAVVDELDIPGRFPAVLRQLEDEPDTEALHAQLTELDPMAAARMEPGNRRRVLRALEVTMGSGRPFSSFGPGLQTYPTTRIEMVGLRRSREVIDRRIELRYQQQMDDGFIDEVRALVADPRGWSRTASQALGYKELAAHVRGEETLEDAVSLAVRRTRRFARRQERWFRRDPRIRWIDLDDPAEDPSMLRELAAGLARGWLPGHTDVPPAPRID